MDHSYEEIRQVAIDILADRETISRRSPDQFQSLLIGVAEVFERREESTTRSRRTTFSSMGSSSLSRNDTELFREVFWDLFRQGIITLGTDDANREFPFFKLSSYGRRVLKDPGTYFFHDVSSYEQVIKQNIPQVDDLTLLYLKEAMQAFRVNCTLSASVMLGVATEHTFLKLLETIEANSQYSSVYRNVFTQRTILHKFNKFRNILDQNLKDVPSKIKEDLDTNLSGILSIIRNFRNESGHPSGKIISREQCYILLNLFIPYCKKIYQMMAHFS